MRNTFGFEVIVRRVTQEEELSLPRRRHSQFLTEQLRHQKGIPSHHKDINHVLKDEKETQLLATDCLTSQNPLKITRHAVKQEDVTSSGVKSVRREAAEK